MRNNKLSESRIKYKRLESNRQKVRGYQASTNGLVVNFIRVGMRVQYIRYNPMDDNPIYVLRCQLEMALEERDKALCKA